MPDIKHSSPADSGQGGATALYYDMWDESHRSEIMPGLVVWLKPLGLTDPDSKQMDQQLAHLVALGWVVPLAEDLSVLQLEYDPVPVKQIKFQRIATDTAWLLAGLDNPKRSNSTSSDQTPTERSYVEICRWVQEQLDLTELGMQAAVPVIEEWLFRSNLPTVSAVKAQQSN